MVNTQIPISTSVFLLILFLNRTPDTIIVKIVKMTNMLSLNKKSLKKILHLYQLLKQYNLHFLNIIPITIFILLWVTK